jgi:hypothetical protein
VRDPTCPELVRTMEFEELSMFTLNGSKNLSPVFCWRFFAEAAEASLWIKPRCPYLV